MSRKNILKPFEVSVNQSLAAGFTTAPTVVAFSDNIAYQINITTSNSTGTFSVQASLDYEVDPVGPSLRNPGNWIDLTLSGSPTVAAANDNIIINLNQLPFNAIRLKYTPTVAGTGHANIYIMNKQIGG